MSRSWTALMTCSRAGAGRAPGREEDQDAVAEGHQRGDRGDPRRRRQLLLVLGVDLAEAHVGVLVAGGLEHRAELLARPAPTGPPVDQRDAGLGNSFLERLFGEFNCAHGAYNATGPAKFRPAGYRGK